MAYVNKCISFSITSYVSIQSVRNFLICCSTMFIIAHSRENYLVGFLMQHEPCALNIKLLMGMDHRFIRPTNYFPGDNSHTPTTSQYDYSLIRDLLSSLNFGWIVKGSRGARLALAYCKSNLLHTLDQFHETIYRRELF